MEELKKFQKNLTEYINNIPDIVQKRNISPFTTLILKELLIEFINSQNNIPDNIKKEMYYFINNDTNYYENIKKNT